MNREIKFRAWHQVAKEILYDHNFGDCLRWYGEGQPLEIMQYIGLHDNNGREMYEGDVYKQFGRYFVIEWSECGFEVRNIKSGQIIPSYLHEIATDEDSEYIGSIYENTQFTQS